MTTEPSTSDHPDGESDIAWLGRRRAAGRPIGGLPIGGRVGRYKILEKIGEGGWGVVYRAEQLEPVRRVVALKMIMEGRDSGEVVARFEAERQALALMQHANIATVHDAGSTDDGRPYFVMELVAGEPVTTYCDRQRLGIDQRLRVFRQICDAVQHAHQKGVIHRDIKPSNVLVTVRETEPVVKVIDFGVAKAIGPALSDKTVFTEMGRMIGTPAYMSPEQAEMTGLDIDTRSDVYALGVMLYELLAGALPFDSKSLREQAFAEIQRIIREVDPPRPSTRLSTLDEQASRRAADNRRVDPAELRRLLQRDLEWIPLKAMEKDRTRRYQSAAEMAEDVSNYLDHRPLRARRPSPTYVLQKFVRRHRGAVTAAAALAVVAVLGGTGTGVGLVQKARADTRAEATASAFKDFLVGAANQAAELGPDPPLGSVLPAVAEQIDYSGVPAAMEVEIRLSIADAFRPLGMHAGARDQARRALDRSRDQPDPDEQTVVETLVRLAQLSNEVGAYADAVDYGGQVESALAALAPPDAGLEAQNISIVAESFHNLGAHTLAEYHYRLWLSAERDMDPESIYTAEAIDRLARILIDRGDPASALPLVRQSLDAKRRHFGSRDVPGTATVLLTLGYAQRALGRWTEADAALGESRGIYDRFNGGKYSPLTQIAAYELAGVREDAPENAGVEPPDEPSDVIDLWPLARQKIILLRNRGSWLFREGRREAAESRMNSALDLDRLLQDGHEGLSMAHTHRVWGLGLEDLGDLAGAQRRYRETLDLQGPRLSGRAAAVRSDTLVDLGRVLRKDGRAAEGAPHLKAAVELRRAHLPSGAWPIAAAEVELAEAMIELGRAEAARPLLGSAIRVLAGALGPDDPRPRHARKILENL